MKRKNSNRAFCLIAGSLWPCCVSESDEVVTDWIKCCCSWRGRKMGSTTQLCRTFWTSFWNGMVRIGRTAPDVAEFGGEALFPWQFWQWLFPSCFSSIRISKAMGMPLPGLMGWHLHVDVIFFLSLMVYNGSLEEALSLGTESKGFWCYHRFFCCKH